MYVSETEADIDVPPLAPTLPPLPQPAPHLVQLEVLLLVQVMLRGAPGATETELSKVLIFKSASGAGGGGVTAQPGPTLVIVVVFL